MHAPSAHPRPLSHSLMTTESSHPLTTLFRSREHLTVAHSSGADGASASVSKSVRSGSSKPRLLEHALPRRATSNVAPHATNVRRGRPEGFIMFIACPL